MSLSERIKKRRIELGYTQDELAKKLGYKSRSAINKIEKGINDITQSKIVEFANILQCSPAYLMGWEDVKEDNISPLTPNVHLSPDAQKLLNDYYKLNTSGREKASEYVADLTTMKKYIDADVKSKLG